MLSQGGVKNTTKRIKISIRNIPKIGKTSTKSKRKKQKADYYLKNKKRINETNKKWYLKNKEKRISRCNEYAKSRRVSDPLYKLAYLIRIRTIREFKRIGADKASTKSLDLLGADLEVVKAHIESRFTEGMSWENHGEWHIDHIYPLSRAKNEKQLKELCNYKNLQPLWAKDNREKSNKL